MRSMGEGDPMWTGELKGSVSTVYCVDRLYVLVCTTKDGVCLLFNVQMAMQRSSNNDNNLPSFGQKIICVFVQLLLFQRMKKKVLSVLMTIHVAVRFVCFLPSSVSRGFVCIGPWMQCFWQMQLPWGEGRLLMQQFLLSLPVHI